MRRLIYAITILFPLFLSQYSFSQWACITNNNGITNGDYVPNEGTCFATETGYSGGSGVLFWGGISFGLFGNINNVPYVGSAGGDLGALLPSTPTRLSTPCQIPGQSGQPSPDLVWRSGYTPGVHVVEVEYTRCDGIEQQTVSAGVVVTVLPYPSPPTPCGATLIDPVASQLLRGTSITTNTAILASGGTSVSGVSSDGVTQVLVRIPANQAGDSFTLTLINDQGQQSSSTSADGGLYALGGNPGSASSTMTVQAQNTSPPTAFAVYSAPSNYYRGTQDAAAAQRDITLQVNCSDANGSPSQQTANVLIVRPPVVLVHGLWSNPGQTWNNFSPASPQNQSLWNNALSKRYVDYSTPVSGITATTPSYLPALTTVSGSALGLAYNAPYVLSQVQAAVNDLENHYNVAAVQADVVAHSMGGNISRVMATLPNFTNPNNYGAGPVHKLITIGTPHTGTPLADALLPNSSSDPNACVRKALQLAAADVSLQTVTIGGNVANGAVGDLQFPQLLYGTTQTFPIAYIAGQTNTSNLALLNVPSGVVVDGIPVPTESQVLQTICGTLGGDPLAQSLTTNGWNFGAFTGSPNDGIVPVVSQLNNTNNAGALVFIGFIHSPGMETLDFVGPSEVDSASGIPDEVINLLDEATNGSDFNQ